ncbi:MAG TPA: neutral zinc metallopeptidase [Bauldia sp.]|nr:neutral zinc metallopeptidase [Bauldia sp.]
MRWRGRQGSSNVEDRRGQGGGFGGGFGRGGFGLPGGLGGGPRIGIPMGGRGGGIGLVGILIILAILWFSGVFSDGGSPIGVGEQPGGGSVGVPADEAGQFAAVVLADTEDTWGRIFEEGGERYREPTLVLFTGQVSSACGFASAAAGPFYCPGDQKLYLDLSFFDELSRRFGAPGDFANAYVIAHEVGHHVQNLLGVLPEVDAARRQSSQARANELSVLLELQADCLAGVWAHDADAKGLLEVGDIDEALNAAAAIGDDTLQRETQGYVVPDSFTHGTSAQRSQWFKRGYEQGRLDACDTFATANSG